MSFQSVAGRSGRPPAAEHDEPVLLARDGDRADVARTPRRGERAGERAPPHLGIGLPRATLARDAVGSLTLRDDAPVLGVDEHHFGRLRGAVDTGYEVRHGRVVWRRTVEATRRSK